MHFTIPQSATTSAASSWRPDSPSGHRYTTVELQTLGSESSQRERRAVRCGRERLPARKRYRAPEPLYLRPLRDVRRADREELGRQGAVGRVRDECLGAPRDLAKVFDTTEYAKWKGFRSSDDSRYVALTLPHILMRDPYGKKTRPVDEFDYEEGVDGSDHSKYLWGNAAWALAARITDSFAQYNWCATIRGVEGGGKVEGLTVHNFATDEGDIAMK